MGKDVLARRLAVTVLLLLFVPVASASAASVDVVAQGLHDPRGIDADRKGRVLVAEAGSGRITEIKSKKGASTTKTFATLPANPDVGLGPFDVAIRNHNKAYVVMSGPPETAGDPFGQLVRVKRGGEPSIIADIAAYQEGDPDPADQEDNPVESNPNGLALLHRRGILVVDAANNDLLRVSKDGSIETVVRFPPQVVPFPSGLPDGPPPGTPFPAESVPTAVAIGPDGAWYVSELIGFPFPKGASRIWRIEPGTKDFDCDAAATRGPCRVFADGFTSVIDLAFAGGTLLVLELVKEGLLGVEMGGAPPIGALWAVDDGSRTEIAPGELLAPGGVAVADDKIYVTTGTVFGPGAGEVVRITLPEDEPDDDRPRGDDDDGRGDDDHPDDDDDRPRGGDRRDDDRPRGGDDHPRRDDGDSRRRGDDDESERSREDSGERQRHDGGERPRQREDD